MTTALKGALWRLSLLLLAGVLVNGCRAEQVTMIAAQVNQCQVPDGVRQKRSELRRELGSATGRRVDEIQSELAHIHQQYAVILRELDRANATPDVLATCCKQLEGESGVLPLCALRYYESTNRVYPDVFLSAFPEDAQALEEFWRLDEIQVVGSVPAGHISRLLDEVMTLARSGNANALKTYMALFADADGAYAEEMLEPILSLFETHPDVVMSHWAILRPHEDRLRGLQEYFGRNRILAVANRYQELCKSDSLVCEEILRVLR